MCVCVRVGDVDCCSSLKVRLKTIIYINRLSSEQKKIAANPIKKTKKAYHTYLKSVRS